jgi:hypothetical protein
MKAVFLGALFINLPVQNEHRSTSETKIKPPLGNDTTRSESELETQMRPEIPMNEAATVEI